MPLFLTVFFSSKDDEIGMDVTGCDDFAWCSADVQNGAVEKGQLDGGPCEGFKERDFVFE